MFHHRFFKPAALLLIALAVAGCRPLQPVANIENSAYGSAEFASSKRLGLVDYEKAIIRAGSSRNWVFERVGPGHLVGTVDVRGKHRAVVDIFFDTETYSISYKDSQNLKYNAEENSIHPNYNSWVQLLETEIKAEIQRLRAA